MKRYLPKYMLREEGQNIQQYMNDAEKYCLDVLKRNLPPIREIKVEKLGHDMNTRYDGEVLLYVKFKVSIRKVDYPPKELTDSMKYLVREYPFNRSNTDPYIKYFEWEDGFTESLRSQGLFYTEATFGIKNP